MKTGTKFFKKMMVALLSAAVIATMLPTVVMAAGKNYTSATKVSFDTMYSGSITENNKVDWYKIVLTEGGFLKIRCEANICRVYYNFFQGENADTQLTNEAVSWESNTNWSNHTYQTRVAAGTYYFRVTKDSNYAYYGDYNITVSFERAGESFVEKIGGINNSFNTASTISLNKEYTGQLCGNDSKDYYKFYVPSDTTVTIPATAYITRLDWFVYDEQQNQLHSSEPWSNSTTGFSRSDITLNLKKGTYYFVAVRVSSCDGIYNFKVNVDLSGWQRDSKGWWYRNSDGSYPAFQWKQISGKWYYFDISGYITIGWKQLGGKWYHFDNNGAMQTGWLSIGGKWYCFDNNGAMQTGWVSSGGKWYYLKADGSMATNEYCGGYWLNADGTWTYQHKATWRMTNNKWWYGDNTGWYAKNQTLKIDGKNYNFNGSGYCTNP
ncbi:MAG: hypothetical protein K5665_04640 [Saccharofermentans sp.]|nr:hypothetical protein [Saccharofermentans sp.]